MSVNIKKLNSDRGSYVEIKIDNSTYLLHAEQYLELVEAIRREEQKNERATRI